MQNQRHSPIQPRFFFQKNTKDKEVLPMKRKYIEYKVTEDPEQTERGLEWVVIFKRVYL